MKHLVTLTVILILATLSQGCRHRTERLEPYGWTLIDQTFDSLTRSAEQYMYTNVSLDSIEALTSLMDSIARTSSKNKDELQSRSMYWNAYRLYMGFEHDEADELLAMADSLTTDLYTKERISSLKMTFCDFKSYESFCNLLRQLDYYDMIGDMPQQGNTASIICNSLMYTEVPELALYYLNLADSLYQASGNGQRSDNLRINKATLLCNANMKAEADDVYRQLLSDSTVTSNELVHELLLRNHYYFFEDSASLFNAYTIRKNIESETLQSKTLTLLYECLIGEYYLNKGKMDSAAFYIENRVMNPDSIYDEDLQAAIYEIYTNYYEATGEMEKAFASLCRLNDIRVSLKENQQSDNKISADFMNAKQQIQTEAKEEEKLLRIRLYTTIAVAVMLLLMIVIVVRRWHSRHKAMNRKTTRLAEQRGREMMAMALSRQQSDRILDYVEDEISRLSREEELTGRDITRLDKSLRLHLSDREALQSFEKTFTKIHPDFDIKLRAVAPDLSENQIRLCSYIVLGLNNQEIASLMNIKPGSLRQARLRLRQKFGLTKDDSLPEFLKKITRFVGGGVNVWKSAKNENSEPCGTRYFLSACIN